MAEKTQQVLDVLANHNEFKELVQKGSLKTMTLKQFIMILQLFLKPIVGTTVNIDVSNYIDCVHNLITSLEYPYSMNKSSLKTPSAPHCQNSIILLLAWLTEFTGSEANQDTVEYCATEEFGSPDFTKQFMSKMSEAFVCWNNQDESESSKIQEMRRMYLDKKLGQGGNIETEVERLKMSIDQLERESHPVSLMKGLEDKIEESKQLKSQIKEVGRVNNGLSTMLLSLEADFNTKRALKDKLNDELYRLREKISKQKMTQEGRNKLLMEITEMKSLLESKRTDVMELTEGSSEREIQLSNLVQKKFILIDKLNNSLYKLASECQVAGMHEKFDPSSFEIETTKIGDTVALDDEIERLKRGLTELTEKYHHAIGVITKSAIEKEAEEYQLIAEQNLVAEDLQKLKASLENLNTEKVHIETEFSSFINTIQLEYQQNISKLEQMKVFVVKVNKNIETYNKYIKQVVADNEAFKKKSLAECKAMYEKRKQEVEEKRQKLQEMKNFLTEFAKAQKPLPENIEQIVNDVLKKRDLNNNSSSS